MADKDKQEARELAARAARQSQQAAKNAGRAAKAAAPIVAETAGDAAEKVNDAAEEAVDAVVDATVKTTRKFSPRILSSISSDTGVGFLALSVAIYAGAIAFNKFGAAYSQSSRVVRSSSPETTPLRPVA